VRVRWAGGDWRSKMRRPTCFSTASTTHYPAGKARRGGEMRKMSSIR
jgi:hypothetical protein